MGEVPPDPSRPMAADESIFPHPELLAMLGHELRNPLAPIRNSAALLNALCTDPRQLQLVEIISRNVVQMTRMLDDLLNGASLRRGSLKLTTQRIDVAALIRGALDNVAAAIESRRQHLHISLPAGAVQMHCDPMRLAQVLFTLLSNANRYTPEGGDISLVASITEKELLIEVIDDGAGIDPAALPFLFNMFAQAPQTPDLSQRGLGLGLTISRDIAEIHGGALVAASAGLGQGSSFTLRLPIESARVGESDVEPVSGLAAPSSGTRVLIIDDNEDIAVSFSLVLSQFGFVTMIANSGEQGLKLIEQSQPDVVLLDIGLPDITGVEVARRLRRLPTATQTLVIALSGYTRGLVGNEQANSYFDHYLTKPVEPVEVAALISASLAKTASPS